MKRFHKTVLSTLILSYALASISWMAPLAVYCLNTGYIADFLCEKKNVKENLCKGKCYLNKTIAKQVEKKTQGSESQTIPAPLFEIPAHLVSSSEVFEFQASNIPNTLLKMDKAPQWTHPPSTPPPKTV